MNMSLRHMLALLCIVGVSGIEARSRRKIEWPTATYHAQNEGINVDARVLSKQETQALFDGRGRRLVGRRPILPIEVSIANTSEIPVIIKSITPSFALIDQRSVVDRMYRRSYTKIAVWALAGGVCGIVGGGIIGLGATYAIGVSVLGLATTGYEIIPLGLLVMGGGVTGAGMGLSAGSYGLAKSENDFQRSEYKSLNKQISKHTVNHDIVIKPGDTYTGYIFTKDYDVLAENFSISIV